MIYGIKLMFHIPHFAFVDGVLIGIDYTSFKEMLSERFVKIGVSSWYSSLVKGIYKGREYDEEILTVYCVDDIDTAIINEFITGVSMFHHELRQEYYAYEKDDILVTIKIGEQK